MSRPQVFADGVGTGASLILLVAAALIFSRNRTVTNAIRRPTEPARMGRSPSTNPLPDNDLDLYRNAGL